MPRHRPARQASAGSRSVGGCGGGANAADKTPAEAQAAKSADRGLSPIIERRRAGGPLEPTPGNLAQSGIAGQPGPDATVTAKPTPRRAVAASAVASPAADPYSEPGPLSIHAAAAAGGPAASIAPIEERHRKCPRSPGQPGCGALFQMLRRLRKPTFNLPV